jgi:hypothetical protein
MAILDWSHCPSVESIPGKGARTPVSGVFENLQDMTVGELMEEFGVTRERVQVFWNSRRTAPKCR